jgi:6-phosphogluconolactonase
MIHRILFAGLLLSLFPFSVSPSAALAQTSTWWAYVGTYTQGPSEGIYVFRFDSQTGQAGSVQLAATSENPSFLAIHPNYRYLYAVNEVENYGGQSSGAVTAFEVDAGTGKLRALNQQASKGAAPCHLVVDQQGKNVLLANYTGGSVAVLPIQADGQLAAASSFIQHQGSSITPRQQGPHAHSINLDAANRFAIVADLGLDRLLVYRFDAARGTLEPNDPSFTAMTPGSGPRHFDFHPSQRFAYAINELSRTITALTYDAQRGTLTAVQTVSTLPADAPAQGSTAEVRVHPSGKFVYGSNRGHNSIAIFAVDPQTGQLTPRGHQLTQGSTPRNFVIDPSGKFLLAENQQSGTVVVFSIDQDSGALSPTGAPIEVPSPVCIRFMPAT